MSATVTRTYPVACPICGGCGTVPCNFYHQLNYVTNVSRVQCRQCHGTGVMWATETVAASPMEQRP